MGLTFLITLKKSTKKGIMGGGRSFDSDPLWRSWKSDASSKRYFVYYKYNGKWYLISKLPWATSPHAIKEFIHESDASPQEDGEYIWNTGINARTNYYWDYRKKGTYDSDLMSTAKLDTLKGVDIKKLPTEVRELWDIKKYG